MSIEAPAKGPQQGENPQQSFQQRKMQQLDSERDASGANEPVTITPQDPEFAGTPSEEMESVVEQDAQGLYDDEGEYQDDLEGSPEDLNELPSGEDQDPNTETVDWEKRYKDLQAETQTVREGRGEMEQEHAQSMAKHLELRFEMEDKLSEAVQRAEFMRNVMSNNAAQYQNIDWSRVPPDKVQEVQAQAQQAFTTAQQTEQAYTQMQSEIQQQKELVKQREAAIAKTRLRRTIPSWGNETYSALREFATESGMPANEFNDITNPVIIEWAYAAKQIREGASSVQDVRTNRKSTAPRGKAARRQPRNNQGQYARKQTQPNQKGSFADKHKHRLAAERQGR